MAQEFLEKEGVEVEVVDVAQDENAARELVSKSGQLGVPVIEIKRLVMVGFDRDAYKKALEDAGIPSRKNKEAI
jgi:glutaredoxin 3